MTATIHALLIDVTGAITDLSLSTEPSSQLAQVREALGGDAEVIRNVHSSYGATTTAPVRDERSGHLPNLPAAYVLGTLLNEDLAELVQGPVLFIGTKNNGEFTDLPKHLADRIRVLTPAAFLV
ncbi:hypothetical protein [Streptomyces regalis]|uniref:Uncharacterized protein n=1 Tax=Streptomyces regalis TaxID=68262 RepID=A0A101JAH0_9ACTN|nr:hypothetical protein [Streptomyces regalis]KUL23196.1 hypothetical protein ADL12_39645 [Streptomyces regalis]